MKRKNSEIDSEIDIKQLLQPLPEATQATLRGGAGGDILVWDIVDSATPSTKSVPLQMSLRFQF